MHFQGLYVIQCLGYEDKILHATVQKKHLFHLCLHTTVQTHTVTGTLVNMLIVC